MLAFPLWGSFVLAVVYTLYFARELLVPVLLALLMSIVLSGPVSLLRRAGLPITAGAAAVVLLLVGLIGLAIYELSAPVEEWMRRWPDITSQLRAKFGELQDQIQAAQEVGEQLSEVAEMADQGAATTTTVVLEEPSLLSQLFTGARDLVIDLATILVLTFFLLAWGRPLLFGIIRAMPDAEKSERLANLLRGIGREIAGYLGTVTVINVVEGVVVAGVMWALGMPEPVLWGVLAGLLNYIPYIGPLVMIAILSLVSILTFPDWGEIVVPPLAYFGVNFVEGEFIMPAILGRRLTLNPILVFLSVVVWGWLWGIPGVFLGVPLLAVFKATCDHVEQLQRLRPVLRASPLAPPAEAAAGEPTGGLPAAANGSMVRRLFVILKLR